MGMLNMIFGAATDATRNTKEKQSTNVVQFPDKESLARITKTKDRVVQIKSAPDIPGLTINCESTEEVTEVLKINSKRDYPMEIHLVEDENGNTCGTRTEKWF